ncbi:AarF/ABC1/UbiB kinase family protein [Actinoplanes sp. LDG1-06]|uniref:AarF/ABC1/UbiB kinase family protein n=1 Tax=Paractinoplanes ovalisporus TaxID=2810368 RepID=A0ABS2A2Z8_9ACTN|nr:AarF/UbiB family protein [Actinoplanes ovalisporus]MBM2614220.1 AarF/ABC1/UbiB kinase family protein [Actinoplanes ovalisporus]
MEDTRVGLPRLAGRAATTTAALAAYGGRAVTRRLLRRPPPPGSTARVLHRLGPAYVKVAQLLATRRDQLPEAWCDRLSTLEDRVPAPPAASIAAVLSRSYAGTPPFTGIDLEPLAAGSIATVHRATLPDGRPVAVKVRRDDVTRTLTLDLALLGTFARTAGRLPGLRRVPLDEMVGQVGAVVRRQADFEVERANLVRLRENFDHDDAVRVPAVLGEWCTPDVIVMDLMTGLRPLRPAAVPGAERPELVRRVLTATYQMLFLDGFVHCDLHHGNIYAGAGGSLVVLDGGFMMPLPDQVRRLFAQFFINLSLGRGERCAAIVLESARRLDPGCDREGFTARLAELVRETSGATAAEFSLVTFAGRLFDLQRRHRVYAAPEFVFPLLALLVIEGMVRDLDPEVDFQAVAMPVLDRAVAGQARA